MRDKIDNTLKDHDQSIIDHCRKILGRIFSVLPQPQPPTQAGGIRYTSKWPSYGIEKFQKKLGMVKLGG